MNNNKSFTFKSQRHPATLAAIYGVSLCSSASSFAADDSHTLTVSAQEDNAQGDNVTNSSVGSKTSTPRINQAQSVSVVTQQQLEDFQASSLTDAMRFVSGVTEGNTLGGTEDGFVRRGFGSNSDGSIYRDGVRSSQGLNFDATTERVEVLKGSASLLYGIQNPGGVINVISKKPQYQWHTKVSGRTSSEGGGAGTVDVTGPLGNGFAFRLIAEKQNQDYWRNFGSEKHTLIAPSLQWFGEQASFLISYSDYQYDIPYDRGTAFIDGKPIDIGYKDRLDDKANHAWGHNKTLNAHYDWQFNDDWSTRVTLGWNQRQYDNNEVRVTAVNPTTGVVTRRADANRGFNHKTKYVSWDLIGSQQVLGMTHDLVLGTDYEMIQTYRAHQYQGKANTGFNFNNPQYDILSPITNSSTENTANANNLNRTHSRSIYAKDSISLTDNWIAVLGGRYQHYEQRASKGFDPVVQTLDSEGNKFLPQAGLIYKVTPDVSLYTSVSKSFTPSTDVDDDGNVGKPEQGTTWEVGSKWQISPKLFASVALYRIDERDMSLSINGTTRAINKARSSGAEFELNGEVLPGWDLSANYSYDKAEIVDDGVNAANNGNRLQNAPRHSGALYLSHNLAIPGVPGDFRVGGGARYVGTRAGDPENSFNMPDYVVADSFIAWNNRLFGEKTQLKLNLNNLFNKHYYTSSGGNLRVREGETRNLMLEASVEF
ncbi:iron complex outermembrane recepter protein [Candidatus Pantoea symbiotica]|jgi:iron complex outermembrane receptor protein|uniref:Iron complex outermembrane recepter protein n=1 Tax=Candidatus Pantoea symbiotica TaxID=1884370 RepID=A0A1I3ZKN2_9GAMM|nr:MULTISPECIES: TonB-dependent siderophore receptor [Pantoea]KAJ9430027.1 TonB-dependent siderophore receptor [Pantoea sp. YR343]MRT26605.1 TonB-dependent siderophore receptor [Enterobacteriaceae bacterium RIT697]SFK44622.1 iron complex outermembrane recepter protein [Pantoea symbiotica]SFU93151.1 iron complex outermembrane recepter protein [Pantoea sp. YR525]